MQFFGPFGIAIGVVVDKLRAAIDAAFQTNCYWWINYFTRMAAPPAAQSAPQYCLAPMVMVILVEALKISLELVENKMDKYARS